MAWHGMAMASWVVGTDGTIDGIRIEEINTALWEPGTHVSRCHCCHPSLVQEKRELTLRNHLSSVRLHESVASIKLNFALEA